MNENEAIIPPGFRFHPTEEELVGYYLKKKINSQKIDLDVIIDIDLYRMEPCQIQEKCSKLGNEEENEWYFFSYKDRKYPSGSRTNRATSTGFWKATGRDKAVFSNDKIIGMRKTLVFYNGRAPNGLKSDWIIHEYRLQTTHHSPPHEEGWVVCRAFKKPSPSHNNNQNLGANWNNNNHHYNNYYPITNSPSSSLQLHSTNSSSRSIASTTSLQARHVSQQEYTPINNTNVTNMVNLPELMATENGSLLLLDQQQQMMSCGGLISNNIEAYEKDKNNYHHHNNNNNNKWEIVDSFLGLQQVDDDITATTSWFSSEHVPNLQSYDELEADHNMAYFFGGCPNL